MTTKQALKEQFITIFGGETSALRVFQAPGRVNLIGEHTDYNGGFVFPAALTVGTTIVARKRPDTLVKMAVTDLPDFVTFDFANQDALDQFKDLHWGSYQIGVVKELLKEGYPLAGCELLFHDTVPHGGGLSSSAAIEVATAVAFLSLASDQPFDMVRVARLSQLAEHNFIGVKCGIMDQFASAMGKKNHAIFLNCKDLSFDYVPIVMDGYKIVVSNTKVKRSLATSKYNERRGECEVGLAILKTALNEIDCLGDVSIEQFDAHQFLITDETVRKRCAHIVSEDDRVLRAIRALEIGDLQAFGQLMNGSHDSLRDLYEVTGLELDTMVDEARKIEGVLGSRMTGAGFGGCTVSIVADDAVAHFIQTVGDAYQRVTGIAPEFYVSEIGDGGRELSTLPINGGNLS